MKVKEESEKVGLKLNIEKRKIMASDPITSWEIDGETVETVSDFIFWGSKIAADGDCSHEIKRRMSIESVIRSNHLILCCPLLLLPLVFHSIKVFSSESVLRISWPKYWSFSFSISPSNEYSALIFLRIDWVDLPAVQETLKTLLQHHISKASVLQHSAFLHPFMTTGKIIALTI